MYYAMHSFLDEWGKRYERTIRIRPYKTKEAAEKCALKKGKGAFVCNGKREVLFVV